MTAPDEKNLAVLFGAGASKDAGLPDAFELTDRISEYLQSDEILYYIDPNLTYPQEYFDGLKLERSVDRNIFDYVKQKFSDGQNNIEDISDALEKLVFRNEDPLSKFVTAWDEFFDKIKLPDRSFLRRFNIIISKMLVRHSEDIHYLEKFFREFHDKMKFFATLNQDILAESALSSEEINFDYGLSKWIYNKSIEYEEGKLEFIKLHGSIGWRSVGHQTASNTDDAYYFSEIYKEFNPADYSSIAMIFGKNNNKLYPNGPYLQIRQRFHDEIQKCNYLLIVGYSFADTHINSILRYWAQSRSNAKLVIVDKAAGCKCPSDILRHCYPSPPIGEQTVEVVHIKRGFASCLNLIVGELGKAPVLKKQTGQDGFNPSFFGVRIVE